MSPSTRNPRVPPEGEIRAIVDRVLDGVLATAGDIATAATTREAPEVPSAPAAAPSGLERVAIGADHGGYPLKEHLAFRLREAGHEVADYGTDSPDSTDYPLHAHAVAKAVATGEARWGIVVDGAGIGSAMVANKVPGVRAALCYDLSTARNSREHNHANVLTLGAGLIGDGLAWQIVQEWLSVEWGGGRHARRVALIDEIEAAYLRATNDLQANT
jgi:ribose 5-phosphate isomerase B